MRTARKSPHTYSKDSTFVIIENTHQLRSFAFFFITVHSVARSGTNMGFKYCMVISQKLLRVMAMHVYRARGNDVDGCAYNDDASVE